MKAIAVLAAMAVLGIFMSGRERRARRRRIRETFVGRAPQTEDQFFERHFRERGVSREIVAGVRRILEEHLDADLSRLDVADDFSKYLAFFWRYDSMADVEIVLALEKEFGIAITHEEGAAARTVGDIVELVWAKKRQVA